MPTNIEFKADLSELRDFIGFLQDPKTYRLLQRRSLGRSSRDVRRLLVMHLKNSIRERTTQRTGRLVSVRVMRVRRGVSRDELVLLPTFPRTQYVTQPGRGRPRASKVGQYAFVVNSRRQFIQEAFYRFRNDPALISILRKHTLFIANDIINKALNR